MLHFSAFSLKNVGCVTFYSYWINENIHLYVCFLSIFVPEKVNANNDKSRQSSKPRLIPYLYNYN